ncbi:MAG TPA: ankyrin repeat domain-containing protein [Acetobacteraceae bacterium]|nr:ankyrin repeat domain-containing protein [Acetobacteraceae bacterium]
MIRMSRPIVTISSLAGALALAGLILPAHAQMAGAGLNPAAPMGGLPHPRPMEGDQPPPPGLPGAEKLNSTTSSQVQIENEDPTKVLFTAINHGNYAEARAAISRGADLGARNALGETPLEMSIALNHNNITFMLLSMREADGGGSAAPELAPRPAPVITAASHVRAHHRRMAPARIPASPARPPAPANPGMPNPSAGFLGFGGAS